MSMVMDEEGIVGGGLLGKHSPDASYRCYIITHCLTPFSDQQAFRGRDLVAASESDFSLQ